MTNIKPMPDEEIPLLIEHCSIQVISDIFSHQLPEDEDIIPAVRRWQKKFEATTVEKKRAKNPRGDDRLSQWDSGMGSY